MDVEGRACSARSERADCDAEGTWHPLLPQSFLYNNKPLLAQKGSAAPPSPAMPAPSNQDARAVRARRGAAAAWRLVVLWRAHRSGMTRKVECVSELLKPLDSRYELPFDSPLHPSLMRLHILAKQSVSEGFFL